MSLCGSLLALPCSALGHRALTPGNYTSQAPLPAGSAKWEVGGWELGRSQGSSVSLPSLR